ncbi:MAG: ankyrin repeat domain-containing protein [Gemmatimonadaceae bacterium]
MLPNAPGVPTLRDIQHALALEHGVPGWVALKSLLAGRAAGAGPSHADLVASFLENASLDWRVGGPSRNTVRHTAERLLAKHPEIADDSIHTAVVCGDLDGVVRRLANRPELATEQGGPRNWPPLLYLCAARLSIAPAADNAVAIARALLDRGADPNSYYPGGSDGIRYSALTCVIGEGEENASRHPRFAELTQLLLDRGAEPYDIQVLYNMHFHGDILWFLELMFARAVRLGRQAEWDDPQWEMLGMGGYGPGAHYLLNIAVQKNDMPLAEWILLHGASPEMGTSSHPKFKPTRSFHEIALRMGHTEMADLLVRHGAAPGTVVLTGEEAFAAACMRLDRDAARALLSDHPEYLRSPTALFAAARRDRADAVSFVLDLGSPIDVSDDTAQRALHVAAANRAYRVAQLLIERGAEIDARETRWGNTPLGHAVYGQDARMIDILSAVSRDVFELTYVGKVERLREVLSAEPALARIESGGQSPLMWLPDDERDAMEIARLLLALGADRAKKNSRAETAADIARKRGLDDVAELLESGATENRATLRDYETMADALLDAYRTGTPEAMERHYSYTWHRRAWKAMRTYVQLDLGRHAGDANEDMDISLDDARHLVAREYGFDDWPALAHHIATTPAPNGAVASKPVALLALDERGAEHAVAWTRDWDAAVARMAEEQLPGLNAHGQMTDAVLEQVARLDHVTILKLDGSQRVTDAGVRHLARMPHLRHLDLGGCRISDRALDALGDLPALESISLAWTAVTDAGVAKLKGCDRLERVNLTGTATGDGAIAALAGKSRLRMFRSGNRVTDAGLPLLHEFPAFKTWHGGEITMALLSDDGGPSHLMLRGSFTDAGLASLAGLDGLFALNLDDGELAITAAGLAPLASLPKLGWLAVDATDASMPYIAAMPQLRFLGCQDTTAGDEGFVALARSQSIEHIWGRRCYNLRTRGFTALSTMPALHHLSISCRNVDNSELARLPLFPALRELMPMDVPDDGYRHIGRCELLESLILMYCRETTDRATEHIAGLPHLKKYFASYNQITDRSLEILSRMPLLEEIELSACAGVTNAGVALLARLPRLRELRLDGLQHVARPEPGLFPEHVRVVYER